MRRERDVRSFIVVLVTPCDANILQCVNDVVLDETLVIAIIDIVVNMLVGSNVF